MKMCKVSENFYSFLGILVTFEPRTDKTAQIFDGYLRSQQYPTFPVLIAHCVSGYLCVSQVTSETLRASINLDVSSHCAV